ncbi:MAG: Gfo/Idh/MocA family protein [Thermoguttaceae bacterium]
MTRRVFWKGATLAAGVPLVVPGSVVGNQKKAAPSERLTLGFIGMGVMNRGHLGGFLGYRDCEVLAVCDVDTNRRNHAKKMVEDRYSKQQERAYKGCAAYNDFREVTGRKDIDAVVIATPDHWHCHPVVEAVKNRKDVYCEKPLTLTIAEAKLMIDAVRKYDRVFQTGSQQRSDREFRVACELVRNGRIGKIKTVYAAVGGPSRPCDLPEEPMEEGLDWNMWLGQAPMRPYNSVLSPRGVHKHFPNWRSYREYSGGGMTDWGAHHFDIAQWGLGMDESGPVEVIPPEEPNRQTGVRWVYANGVELIHGSYEKWGGVNFLGTDGWIHVDRGQLHSKPEQLIKEPLPDMPIKLYKSPGHHRDWLECIKTRKRPICDVEIGARSVTVCHLGNIAYWTHKRLKWDPQNWRFLDADAEVQSWFDRQRRDPWQLPAI